MTVGELKQILFEVCDDSLPVEYLPSDNGVETVCAIKGAMVVEKATNRVERLKGVYLLEG